MQRFLVTGANGDIADAIGRVLAQAFPDAQRIGTEIEGAAQWPGSRTFSALHFLPRGDSPDYCRALADLADQVDATLVIPTSEGELQALAQPGARGIRRPLLMNDGTLVLRFLDKLATAQWLNEIGIDAPRTTLLRDAQPSDLPFMVKPRHGRGSRGLEIVRSAARLAVVKAEREGDAVAQALLEPDDAEFTCAIFRWHDDVRTLCMRRRLVGGMTAQIAVENNDSIASLLGRLAAKLPAQACINVQLRLTANGPRIFEINPRLSGTVMMRHLAGFSDLVWWINALSGRPVPPFEAREGTRVYRTYGEIVVPHAAA